MNAEHWQGLARAASMPTADAPCSVRAELGALLRLAVPVSAAFLLNKSISFVGVLFVRYAGPASRSPLHPARHGVLCGFALRARVLPRSHLGPAPLAAASLATSLANVTGYSVMAGLAGATSTLCGQARPRRLWACIGGWRRAVVATGHAV